jgi:coenzyme F420 hydrogenase subunit beta
MDKQSRNGNPDAAPAKGAKDLREEVLDAGLCTSCGMCLDLCPYLEEMGENVAMISDCRGDTGRCYAVCPRTDTDLDQLREAFFPSWADSAPDYVLGPHRSVWMARSRNAAVRELAQYGGTVSALSLFGLDSGRIDAALLTNWSEDPEEPHLTRPWLAKTPKEVLASAGSKYTACPTLRILDSTLRNEAEKLLVVARPCQVLALRKRMRLDDPTFARDHVALTLSLFCMWSLSYREFRKWVGPLLGTEKISRIDIPPGKFVAQTDRETVELPHDEARERSRETCRVCYDFTGELADLSVGSTEWKEDWNTLIVRSEAAAGFVEAAAEQGFIELEPFPEERIHLLREAAFNKKKRVLEALEQDRKQKNKEPYLRISQEEKDFFLAP